MLKALVNAFKVPELRNKILFTLAIIVLYRVGSFIPVPGVPFSALVDEFQAATGSAAWGSMALLNLFSGGALSYVSIFSLGIMPYITASIIMQLMQSVVPSLERWAKEGEAGQRKITQITRYLTLGLALVNAIGYLLLFQSSSFNIVLSSNGVPGVWFTDLVIIITLLAGTTLIMWMGELITQRGVGNGMSLIIFANVISRFPAAIFSSFQLEGGTSYGILITGIIVLSMLAVIPGIVFIERGQRRIPVQYAKRVVGRRVMGGTSTYLPLKVNTAGVIPIIFASALLYLPVQVAAFFPDVNWLTVFSNAMSSGWLNWIASFILIMFFAYFYTAMVFNPTDTADMLRRQGGFVPGVRPGVATANYIHNILTRITLPGAFFLALIAVFPSIIYSFTSNTLIQTFGGTSVLIMVGVALDTMTKVESQLKMHHYEGFFK